MDNTIYVTYILYIYRCIRVCMFVYKHTYTHTHVYIILCRQGREVLSEIRNLLSNTKGDHNQNLLYFLKTMNLKMEVPTIPDL